MRMDNRKVLIVDHEWTTRNLLRFYLDRHHFEVTEAAGGAEALLLFGQKSFDLVILDVVMPDLNGWEVCRQIREMSFVPILLLTSKSDTKDVIYGLNQGADDYMVKPFDPDELMARIHALLRRAEMSQLVANPVVQQPGMEIYPDSRKVLIDGQAVDLTAKEFDLLILLAEQSSRVFTRETLLEKLWGFDYGGDMRAVDHHVKNIREKLQKAGLFYNPIRTVWGVGYTFALPQETA